MKLKLLFFFLLLSHAGLSQEINRYMVFFTSKEGTAYSLDQPHEFLTPRAIERRASQNIPITPRDLPLNEAYVQQLRDMGVSVYFRSRWLNAVMIEEEAQKAGSLTSLAFVDKVALVAKGKRLGARLSSSSSTQETLAVPQVQHELLDIPLMHQLGFTGKGKMIAVLDAGFTGVNTSNKFDHLFRNNQLLHTKDYVGNSTNVYRYHDHGTKSLSTIAVVDSGTFIGTAPEALFLLAVTEDVATEYVVEEYNWLMACEWADSLGADIITSSLGYATFDDPTQNYTKKDLDGKTTVAARAAVWATERGMLVVNSAGNSRSNEWGTITTPADADNILAVGAIDELGKIASFSSPGPSSDGRIKPDVVALGVLTVVVNGHGNFVQSNGTSFSAPQIAGLAAGVWQAFPELTNLKLRDLIIRSGDNYATPNSDYGYGLPSFQRIYAPSDKEEQLFSLFPNPSQRVQEVLQLKSEIPSTKPVRAHVLDVSGRIVLNELLDATGIRSYELNISKLPAGLYILQLVHERGISKHKFLLL